MWFAIDAMNVIGSRPDGWWRDRHGAIAALVERLERWAETHDHRVTVVLEGPPARPLPHHGVDVSSAPRAYPNSADDEIVRLLEADPNPAEVVVVTSDATLAQRARRAGSSIQSSAAFRSMIETATPPEG